MTTATVTAAELAALSHPDETPLDFPPAEDAVPAAMNTPENTAALAPASGPEPEPPEPPNDDDEDYDPELEEWYGDPATVDAMLEQQLKHAHRVVRELMFRAEIKARLHPIPIPDTADETYIARIAAAETYHARAAADAVLPAARMLRAFQQAAVALDRIRNGTRHSLTVHRGDAD